MSASVKKDLLNKVLSVIDEHPDKRVKRIFNMRYIIGHKNKVMSWKKIGTVMKLSIQGCINIHNSAINSFKEQLKEEV
jgi:DNA-directed RNA polymerase specialized sigma subunit